MLHPCFSILALWVLSFGGADGERYSQVAELKDRWLYLSEQCEKVLGGVKVVTMKTADIEVTRGFADFNPVGVVPVDGQFPRGPRYVLFLYPEADHNGAFGLLRMLCRRLACWKQRGYDVVFRYVGDVGAAKDVLNQFADKSLHHAIIGGGGFPWGMQLGPGITDTLLKGGPQTNDLILTLRNKLLLEASVTLDSCSTAGNTYGLGSNFFTWVASKLPGRKVIGSKVSLTDSMWKKAPGAQCVAGDSVVFERGGENQFQNSERGMPNCKEVGQEAMTDMAQKGEHCLSRCGKTCDNAQKEFGQDNLSGVRLLEVDKKAEFNACHFGRTKKVCLMNPA